MSKELGSRPDLCLFHGRRKNRTMQSLLKLRTASLSFHPHSINQNKSHDQGPSPWDGKVHYTHREAMARRRREENNASVRSGHVGGRVLISAGFEAEVQSWDAPVAIQWGSLTEGKQLPEGCGSRHQSHTTSPEATNPENSRHRPLACSMDVLSFTKAF